MRLTEPRTLHAIALYALPVVVAWLGWGAGAALLASLVMALAGMALRLKAMRAAAADTVGVPATGGDATDYGTTGSNRLPNPGVFEQKRRTEGASARPCCGGIAGRRSLQRPVRDLAGHVTKDRLWPNLSLRE